MRHYGFDGLLPKALISPISLLKKKHKTAAPEPIVSEPAPDVSTAQQGKLILLALGAGMVAIAFLGSRQR